MDDNEQNQQVPIVMKHHCRVCNRGFGCAGALGGHMRTHGVGGDNQSSTRFQPSSSNNVEDKSLSDNIVTRSKSESSSKHSYFLRTNTNRFPSHRFATEDLDGDEPLRGKYRMMDEGFTRSYDDGMMMMKFKKPQQQPDYDQEQSCSASREEQDLANCLVMLSNKSFIGNNRNIEENKVEEIDEQEKGMFQCKACKKYFSSHQALGGHRASHKKVKGCYAAKISTNLNEDDNNSNEDEIINNNNQDEIFLDSTETRIDHLDSSSTDHQNRQSSNKIITKAAAKPKDHQCSICQRVFTSGQALGGHKRCHWLTSNNLPDTTLIQNLRDQFQFDCTGVTNIFKKPILETQQNTSTTFDLNFPPLLVDHQNKNPNPIMSLSTNYETTPESLFLQLWGNGCNNEQMKQHGKRVHESLLANTNTTNNNTNNNNAATRAPTNNVEKESRIKKVKLNELKDMNLDGGGSSSRWLQMGIASTNDT